MNRWYMMVSAVGVAYTVQINGITIFSDRWEKSHSDSAPINQWLVNGKNRVDVNVGVGLSKSKQEEKQSISVEIREIDLESGNKEGRLVTSLLWNKEPDKEFPISITRDFKGPDNFPKWEWEGSDVINSEKPNFTGLDAFLASAHVQLSNKNLPAIVKLVEEKTNEMALAYGVPIDTRLADQKEFFSNYFADPLWKMKPLNPKSKFVRVEGDGRLLVVTNSAGIPYLETEEFEDGSKFGLKLYLRHKNGVWHIAR